MPDLTAAQARDLGDYVSLVRRRWIWVVACAVAGLMATVGYLGVAQETYASTAKVQVRATVASTSESVGARTNDAINLDTEAQLVTSQPVATRAGKVLGSTLAPGALARRISVTVPPNTTVMNITFTAGTAEAAQAGATAFADSYLESRRQDAQDVLDANVERLRNLIEVAREDIQDTSVAITRLNGPGQSTDKAFMVARRSTLSAQLASYNSELAPLEGTEVDAGRVILPAPLPTSPVDPDPMVLLPAGLMAGLVLGLGLAGWRERRDHRIHTVAEVERLFGLVPLSHLVARGRGRFVRIEHDVRAFYHSLRANGPEQGEVAALVAPDSSAVAEHLSYSVAELAARSGSPTTYVTRPHSPVIQERRRRNPERHELLDLPDYESLGVITDGEFRSSVLRAQLVDLSATRDFLVLGLPHDDPQVDLPILGRHLDVAVVVVHLGVTRRDTVAAVLSDLTKSGVERVLAVTVDLRGGRIRHRTTPVGDIFAGPDGPAQAREPRDVDRGGPADPPADAEDPEPAKRPAERALPSGGRR
jgi:capsular polysaccharide biosynthesis protein